MRGIAGLTQEELASRAGLSLNAVSALERGQRKRPYPHTVRALSDALDLSEGDRALLLASVPKRGEDEPESTALTPVRDLPRPLTSLLGRDVELMEVSKMIVHPDTRLVTLTGPGGAGKTRLALEVARDTTRRFSDGACFVTLAPLSDKDFVLDEVARTLGIPITEGTSVTEALVARLRRSDALIVLDNFEHLLDATPQLSDLLASCPDLTALVTSRSPLRLRGEKTYTVPPLGLPMTDDTEDVANSPSAMLFVERSRSVAPEFTITAENASEVAAICNRLAGIPLALELAAGKIGFLEPSALLSRLDLALSTPGARDLPERQRTMRATLDWSYDLLTESERRLLTRLSVFSGGFTLDAAEAVGGGTLEDLQSLVDQSLVLSPRDVRDEARYGLLEPIRQYAYRKLKEDAGTDEAHLEHARYYLDLAGGLRKDFYVSVAPEWLETCEIEKDNLRSIFSWSLGPTGDVTIAARLAWQVQSFIWHRGYHREGRQWAEKMLEHDLTGDSRGRAFQFAAMTAFVQGEYETAEIRWREVGEIARRGGFTRLSGFSHAGRGLIAMSRTNHREAVSAFEESIETFESIEDHQAASAVRNWLGYARLALGEVDEAIETFESGLAYTKLARHAAIRQDLLLSLARCVTSQRDYAKAHRLLRDAVELSRKIGDRMKLAQTLEALAVTVSPERDAEWISALLGTSDGLRNDFGAPGDENHNSDPTLLDRVRTEAREVLGEQAFCAATERGRAMTFDEAIEYALERDPGPSYLPT